jgi:hypothetical protein
MENGTIEIHFDLGKAGHELAGPYSRWAESLLQKKRFGWAAKGPVPKQEK